MEQVILNLKRLPRGSNFEFKNGHHDTSDDDEEVPVPRKVNKNNNGSYSSISNFPKSTVATSDLTCVHCFQEVEIGDLYCGSCGKDILQVKLCGQCNHGNKSKSKFCSKCRFELANLNTPSTSYFNSSGLCTDTSTTSYEIRGMVLDVPDDYDWEKDARNYLPPVEWTLKNKNQN